MSKRENLLVKKDIIVQVTERKENTISVMMPSTELGELTLINTLARNNCQY